MAEIKQTIILEGKDRASGVFDTLSRRAKELRKEERETGESALKNIVRGGAGSILDFGADALGVGATVFAIDQIGQALNSSVDKIKDLRKEFREGKVDAGEVADRIAGSLPVYGEIWQAGRKIHDMWDGTADAVERINQETEQTNRMFELQGERAKIVRETIKGMAEEYARLNHERALVNATPAQREALEAQFGKETDAQKTREEAKKHIEELRKNANDQQQIEGDQLKKLMDDRERARVSAEAAAAAEDPRNTVTRKFSDTASQFRKEMEDLDRQIAQTSESMRARAAARESEIKKIEAARDKNLGAADTLEATQRQKTNKELGERRQKIMEESAEDTRRREAELAEARLRAQGKDTEAQVAGIQEHARQAKVEIDNAFKQQLKDLEAAAPPDATAKAGQLKKNRDAAKAAEDARAAEEIKEAQKKGRYQREDKDFANDQAFNETKIELLKQQIKLGNDLAAADIRRLEVTREYEASKKRLVEIIRDEATSEAQRAEAKRLIGLLDDAEKKAIRDAGNTPLTGLGSLRRQGVSGQDLGSQMMGLLERFTSTPDAQRRDSDNLRKITSATERTARSIEEMQKNPSKQLAVRVINP